MAIRGIASASATEQFRQRHPTATPDHFRKLRDLWVSSIGLGTYLGDADERTDGLYADAVETAVTSGCNLIDTAINYRCQRSERVIGEMLERLIAQDAITREELIICTKGGYLPFDGEVPQDPERFIVETVIEPGLAAYDEIVAGCHCLTPTYLDHALQTSLRNLRVETIDVYYLHNPEQQLDVVDRDTLMRRLEAAFERLEHHAGEGRIRSYGVATWNGLRCPPSGRAFLSLERLVELAELTAGSQHHFRAIQLPYNLAMPEAFAFRNQPVEGESLTVLEAAARLDLFVVTSASLLQGRLTRLPSELQAHLPGPGTDAQRALQFVRSTPGVTTALAGMKSRAHVEENLALASQPCLPAEQIRHLFQRRGV